MTSKSKNPEGQIIVDVQKDGKMIVNQEGFDLKGVVDVLAYALGTVFHGYEKENSFKSRKELIDKVIFVYENTKENKKEVNQNESNKD